MSETSDLKVTVPHEWNLIVRYELRPEELGPVVAGSSVWTMFEPADRVVQCMRCELRHDQAPESCPGEPRYHLLNGAPVHGG